MDVKYKAFISVIINLFNALYIYNAINTALLFFFLAKVVTVYDHALWVPLTSSVKQERAVDWGWSGWRPIIWSTNLSFVFLNHSSVIRCKRELNSVLACCLWIGCLCTHMLEQTKTHKIMWNRPFWQGSLWAQSHEFKCQNLIC